MHKTDTHDSGECKVLLNQAEKMRASWEAQDTPTRKSYDQKKRKELNMLVAAQVAKAIKKHKKGDQDAHAFEKQSVSSESGNSSNED